MRLKGLKSIDRAAVKFEEFRQNLKFCDVSLQSGHVVVKAHRAVLAAASPYFESMFNGGLKESSEALINLPSIHPDVLPLLVDFIYTGRVTVQPPRVQELLQAAHMLCLDRLVTSCAHYLKTQTNTSNALSMLSIAESHGCSRFTEYILVYIAEHWTIIAQGNELLELPLALFTKILSSNEFVVDNELAVVVAAKRWLEHDPESRAPHCSELMRHLRLGRVPANVLNEVWRTVRDTRVAESLQLSTVREVAKVNLRARDSNAFYVIQNPYEEEGVRPVTKYNIHKKTWQEVVSMQSFRYDPGVVALGDRLYVVGGIIEKPMATGEVYDPVTNEWSAIADMNEARSHFGLVTLNGKLYALGGRGADGELASVEVYDPAVNKWAPAGDLPRPMSDFSAVAYNSSIYLTHGRSLLRYCPLVRPQPEWYPCADMRCVHYGHGAAIFDGYLYVVGGYNNQGYALDIVERYDFATDKWEFTTPKLLRVGRCVASAANGVLFVSGKDSLQMYNADDDRWTPGPVPPQFRNVAGSAILW